MVDASSDVLSRVIDYSKIDLLFACAQKNVGPSGVTLVVARKKWIEESRALTERLPEYWRYSTHMDNQSLYNTPPTFAIYLAGLVFKWIENQGGVAALEAQNQEKSALLYQAIESSSFYTSPIRPEHRSQMNVVFQIQGGNPDLEAQFVSEAAQNGLNGLKGHRAIGGLRASIYNAVSKEAVQTLISFMEQFEKKHG